MPRRNPADEDVIGADMTRLRRRAQLREDVAVRQHRARGSPVEPEVRPQERERIGAGIRLRYRSACGWDLEVGCDHHPRRDRLHTAAQRLAQRDGVERAGHRVEQPQRPNVSAKPTPAGTTTATRSRASTPIRTSPPASATAASASSPNVTLRRSSAKTSALGVAHARA